MKMKTSKAKAKLILSKDLNKVNFSDSVSHSFELDGFRYQVEFLEGAEDILNAFETKSPIRAVIGLSQSGLSGIKKANELKPSTIRKNPDGIFKVSKLDGSTLSYTLDRLARNPLMIIRDQEKLVVEGTVNKAVDKKVLNEGLNTAFVPRAKSTFINSTSVDEHKRVEKIFKKAGLTGASTTANKELSKDANDSEVLEYSEFLIPEKDGSTLKKFLKLEDVKKNAFLSFLTKHKLFKHRDYYTSVDASNNKKRTKNIVGAYGLASDKTVNLSRSKLKLNQANSDLSALIDLYLMNDGYNLSYTLVTYNYGAGEFEYIFVELKDSTGNLIADDLLDYSTILLKKLASAKAQQSGDSINIHSLVEDKVKEGKWQVITDNDVLEASISKGYFDIDLKLEKKNAPVSVEVMSTPTFNPRLILAEFDNDKIVKEAESDPYGGREVTTPEKFGRILVGLRNKEYTFKSEVVRTNKTVELVKFNITVKGEDDEVIYKDYIVDSKSDPAKYKDNLEVLVRNAQKI